MVLWCYVVGPIIAAIVAILLHSLFVYVVGLSITRQFSRFGGLLHSLYRLDDAYS